MVDLKEGQQLNHSYTYTLSGTRYRQEHLKSGKFFICKCERCVDPTELGTHFSSFKCTKCESGWFHTTNAISKRNLYSYCFCTKAVLLQMLQLTGNAPVVLTNYQEKQFKKLRLLCKWRSTKHCLRKTVLRK